jgi:hypothetical protein
MAKLTPSNNPHKGRSVKALKNSFVDHLSILWQKMNTVPLSWTTIKVLP